MDQIVLDLLQAKHESLQGDINHADCAGRKHQATADMFSDKAKEGRKLQKAIEELMKEETK